MRKYYLRAGPFPKAGLLRTIVALALFIGLLPAQGFVTSMQSWQKVHPVLREMAAQDSEQMVRVIVQQMGGQDRVEAGSLEGVVVSDLPIINAVVLDLPARNVAKLAAQPAVRAISLDAPLQESGKPCSACIDTGALLDVYASAIGATTLWNQPPYLQGQGVTVAVVDSGVVTHNDLGGDTRTSRILANEKVNAATPYTSDKYGHGTHVAGIIGGDGYKSRGARIGIAPKVSLVNVKVSDDRGAGTTADLVNGLQWVLNNKNAYNIRVVNVSLNSSVAESYRTNPISAAVEILWFNGIVVVVSAGNNGMGANNGVLYPPANDPFVITVGAVDDRGTAAISDDVLAPFSAYGVTADGFAKPDIVAPGTNIISLLSSNSSELAKGHPSHRVDGFAGGKDYYFRMSGTSMATAVVSGAAALLLQDEPGLNPDQVKYRLMATARPFAGPAAGSTGAGYLDIYAAVHGTTTASSNTGIAVSQLLATGSEPITWSSGFTWGSVNWNSVNWNSVNWNSVNWNSVNWNSLYWDDAANSSTQSSQSISGNSEADSANVKPRIYLPAISTGN